MRSDLVDLTLFLHVETDKAWRVSDNGSDTKAVWLPKSQVEMEPLPGSKGGREAVFTIPEWLAIEKGLV